MELICKLCRNNFRTIQEILLHKLDCVAPGGEKKRSQLCLLCFKLFSRKAALAWHYIFNHRMPNFKRSDSDVKIKSRRRIIRKKRSTGGKPVITPRVADKTHSESVVAVSCILDPKVQSTGKRNTECEVLTTTSKRNTLSGNNTGTEEQGNVSCTECGVLFKSMKYLKRHQQYFHSQSLSAELACDQCDYQAVNKWKLQHHKQSKHTLFRCGSCNFTSATNAAIRAHSREHSQGLYKCDLCDKAFRLKDSMNKHKLKVHDTSRPYSCKFTGCNQRFMTLGSCQSHMKSHYRDDSGGFKCHECGAVFRLKHHMKRHRQTAHNIPYIRERCVPRRISNQVSQLLNSKRGDNFVELPLTSRRLTTDIAPEDSVILHLPDQISMSRGLASSKQSGNVTPSLLPNNIIELQPNSLLGLQANSNLNLQATTSPQPEFDNTLQRNAVLELQSYPTVIVQMTSDSSQLTSHPSIEGVVTSIKQENTNDLLDSVDECFMENVTFDNQSSATAHLSLSYTADPVTDPTVTYNTDDNVHYTEDTTITYPVDCSATYSADPEDIVNEFVIQSHDASDVLVDEETVTLTQRLSSTTSTYIEHVD